MIGDAPAMSQPQFAQMRTIGEERRNGLVFEVPAVVQIDLENVATVARERDDRSIGQLLAAVEFELQMLAMSSRRFPWKYSPSSNADSSLLRPRGIRPRSSCSL